VLSRGHHEPEDGVAFPAGDLASGAGVDFAADGVETIVHCAGTAKQDDVKARNLVRAAKSAGATHLVFISVVGADRIPVVSRADRAMFGYDASKRAAEIVVERSGLSWTTLRATQFHDLIYTVVGAMAKLPVIPVRSGSGSSQPTPVRSPPVSSISPGGRQPAWCPTSPAPRHTGWTRLSTATSRPPTRGDRRCP
jgi:uncharacterized protein YbjT (DUF2867 family)